MNENSVLPLKTTFDSKNSPREFADYKPAGKWCRKVVAIPHIFISGVIKTTYHTAVALFIGIPKAAFDKGACFKRNFTQIGVDIVEAVGWIITLFDDRVGQSLLNDVSKMRKGQTKIPLEVQPFKLTSGESTSYSLKNGILIPDEAEEITLLDLKKKSKEEKEGIYRKLGVTKVNYDVDKILSVASDNVLESTTTTDLFLPKKHTLGKFIEMDDERFLNLSIMDLEGYLNSKQNDYICKRLKSLLSQEKGDNSISSLANVEDPEKIKIADLIRYDSTDIAKYHEKLPNLAFCFFDLNQLKELTLSSLPKKKVEIIFRSHKEDVIVGTLAIFQTEDILQSVHLDFIPEHILGHIPESVVEKLELLKLSNSQIRNIYSGDFEKNKKRFSRFSPEDMNEAVNKKIVDGEYTLGLISDEQLKKLDVTKFSQRIINDLFPYQNKYRNWEEIKRSFSLLKGEDTQILMEKKILEGEYHLGLISDEQLKMLDVTKFSQRIINDLFPYQNKYRNREEIKERFSLLKGEHIQILLENKILEGEYRLGLISDDQLKKLDVTKFSQRIINDLFPYQNKYRNREEIKERFSLLKGEDIQILMEKKILEGEYHLGLISDEQLKKLDVTKFSQRIINDLFPFPSTNRKREEIKERFSLLKTEEVRVLINMKTLKSDYHLGLLSNEHLKTIKLPG